MKSRQHFDEMLHAPALMTAAEALTLAVVIMMTAAMVLMAAAAVPAYAQDERDTTVQPSGTIPILSFTFEDPAEIDLMNNSDNHKYRTQSGVTLDITVPEGYTNTDGLEAGGSVSGLKLKYMRGRGNSTWQRSFKKPYKFVLKDRAALLGMNSAKHWALLTERTDPSLSRNRITSWLGQQLDMEFTPRCIPVDLVFNGIYYGSYVLFEDVRVDTASVNIDELTADITDPDSDEITGGYFLGMCLDDSDINRFFTTREVEFTNDTPSFDPEADDDAYDNPAQMKYIRDYIQSTEDAIFGDGFKDKDGKSYGDYMDLKSAADYWLIQEFSLNDDSFSTPSTYLYKKRNGKLYWGPLWDFDIAWTPGPRDYEGFSHSRMIWFDRMRTDPEFAELLKQRWSVLDEKLQYATKQGGLLDQYIAEIKASWNTDRAANGPFEYDFDPFESCEASVEDLRTFIDRRREWVSGHIDEVGKVYADVTFVANGKTIKPLTGRVGEPLYKNFPKAPSKKGYYFKGWYLEGAKEAFDESDDIYDDITLYARYAKKRANPIKASGRKVKLSASKLRKRSLTIKAKKAYKVRKRKGTLSYKKKSVSNKKFAKKFKINKKTGKITVKRGVRKGTYKLRVKITAAGTKVYKKRTRTVTVTIRVR